MKILLLLLLLCVCAFAQQAYVHDPSLDSIGNNVGVLDADLNGWYQTNGKWLTLPDVDSYGKYNVNTFSTNIPNQALNGAAAIMANSAFGSVLYIWSNTNPASMSSAYKNLVAPFNFGSNSFWSGTNYAASLTNTTSSFAITMPVEPGGVTAPAMQLNLGAWAPILTPSFCASIKSIAMLIWYMVLFRWSLDRINKLISDAQAQTQKEGAKQEAFGFDADWITGSAYAAIATAVITAAIGYIVTQGFLYTAYSSSLLSPSNSASAIQFIHSLPSWEIMTALLPIDQMLPSFVNFLAFYYLYAWPLFFCVRIVVWYMIA